MQSSPKPTLSRRVAVVAIHGVADQQPGSTAHRISNLLLMHKPETYTGFIETDVRIGVQKVRMGSRDEERDGRSGSRGTLLKKSLKTLFQINPRSSCVREARDAPKQAAGDATVRHIDDLQHKYMREQLEEYEPQTNDAIYESIRLSGARLPPQSENDPNPSRDRCDVHVYEAYWADLSRAAGTLRRLVVEFYLLLFFLCGLGRHSIEFAQIKYAEARQTRWWRWFGCFQFLAESFLVLGLPITNLCLLGLGAVALPTHLPARYHHTALIVGIPVLALTVTSLLLYLVRYALFKPERWPFSILPLVGMSAVISWGTLSIVKPWNPLVPLAALCWALAAVAILWTMAAYQKRKKGAFVFSCLAVVAVSAVLFFNPRFHRGADVHGILDATLFAVEVTFALLCVSWLGYSLCYLGVCATGYFAVKTVEGKAAQAAARQVRWTVHLTLILPGVLLAIANVVAWQALLLLVRRLIPDNDNYYVPVLLSPWIYPASLVTFSEKMVQLTAGPYFTSAYLLAMVTTLAFLWMLLPVLVTELRVPARAERTAQWLGHCLDKVYKLAIWPGVALALVIALTPVLYALTWWDPHYEKLWPESIRQHPGKILAWLGSALLLMVVGSKLPFKAAGKTLRNVIDIALDVTNWLRMYPKRANPKARISARFVSLLRHIHTWRGPDDGLGYAGVVIIAHSQGTVIAAEVLRFIQKEATGGAADPLLKGLGTELPIFLFTMGSPLRQLYSLRFPHHYAWAGQGDEQKPLRMPDPQALRVTKWVNVYRSADYVGRYLWRDDTGDERWGFARHEPGPTQCEWCLGGGAHNHYWDENAPEVAEELDKLILQAATTPGIPSEQVPNSFPT
jgi:hypothetical protein